MEQLLDGGSETEPVAKADYSKAFLAGTNFPLLREDFVCNDDSADFEISDVGHLSGAIDIDHVRFPMNGLSLPSACEPGNMIVRRRRNGAFHGDFQSLAAVSTIHAIVLRTKAGDALARAVNNWIAYDRNQGRYYDPGGLRAPIRDLPLAVTPGSEYRLRPRS